MINLDQKQQMIKAKMEILLKVHTLFMKIENNS